MITVGSLFSGIGGLDLAFQWAGASIVYQVEIDEYCRRVLAKHWPGVARHEDVKHVGKHNLPAVDIVCGGVPCQPASLAGKQRGEADERWLWPDAIRIVDETRPRAFLWENVPGLRTLSDGRAFAGVVGAFTALGYRVEWHHLSAADVGASHKRERIWIVGYAVGIGHSGANVQQSGSDGDGHSTALGQVGSAVVYEAFTGGLMGYPDQDQRGTGAKLTGELGRQAAPGPSIDGHRDGPPKPGMGGTVDGLSARLDVARIGEEQHEWEAPRMAPKGPEWANRIKALGNAVVPQQAYPFARALVDWLSR